MHTPRIALAARCLQLPLQKVIPAAHQLGANGLQFEAGKELNPREFTDTGRRQLLHGLGERDLSVSSLLVEPDRPLWDENGLQQRVDTLRQTMQFAWDLRSRLVITRTGRLPDNESQLAVLVDVLNDLAAHGNRCGVILALTPSRDPLDEVRAVLDRVTAGPLGLNFDPATIMLSGQSIEEAWRSLYSRVVHVQARDAIRDLDGQGVEVALGRGEVEWDELLPLIREAEFNGWYTVDRTSGDDRAGDAGRAVSFIRHVLADQPAPGRGTASRTGVSGGHHEADRPERVPRRRCRQRTAQAPDSLHHA